MEEKNLSYEQHKLENLHKQLEDYNEMTAELEAHCKAKYGISLETLSNFKRGVKQDIQKEEQAAMRDGASINLSHFKDKLNIEANGAS